MFSRLLVKIFRFIKNFQWVLRNLSPQDGLFKYPYYFILSDRFLDQSGKISRKSLQHRLNHFFIRVHFLISRFDEYLESKNLTNFWRSFKQKMIGDPCYEIQYILLNNTWKLYNDVSNFQEKSNNQSKWRCFCGSPNELKHLYEFKNLATVSELYTSNLLKNSSLSFMHSQ